MMQISLTLGPKLDRVIAKKIITKNIEKYYPSFNQKTIDELTQLYLKNDSDWQDLVEDLSRYFRDSYFNHNAVHLAATGRSKLYNDVLSTRANKYMVLALYRYKIYLSQQRTMIFGHFRGFGDNLFLLVSGPINLHFFIRSKKTVKSFKRV